MDGASLDHIAERIESLKVQEQDSYAALGQECNPQLLAQVVSLICRIRCEREHLERVLAEAIAAGQRLVRWSELIPNCTEKKPSAGATSSGVPSNVIEFRPRKRQT